MPWLFSSTQRQGTINWISSSLLSFSHFQKSLGLKDGSHGNNNYKVIRKIICTCGVNPSGLKATIMKGFWHNARWNRWSGFHCYESNFWEAYLGQSFSFQQNILCGIKWGRSSICNRSLCWSVPFPAYPWYDTVSPATSEFSQPIANKDRSKRYPKKDDPRESFAAPKTVTLNFFMISPPENMPKATAGMLMRPEIKQKNLY